MTPTTPKSLPELAREAIVQALIMASTFASIQRYPGPHVATVAKAREQLATLVAEIAALRAEVERLRGGIAFLGGKYLPDGSLEIDMTKYHAAYGGSRLPAAAERSERQRWTPSRLARYLEDNPGVTVELVDNAAFDLDAFHRLLPTHVLAVYWSGILERFARALHADGHSLEEVVSIAKGEKP